MSSAESHWSLVETVSEGGLTINIYRSALTSMQVCLADVKSPLVRGYFALRTEDRGDYGLPHTLEHATFMGSNKYPYKGILDLVANRCFADGTNAWTATHSTVYTVETAGSEGFLNMLAIYVDHILHARITDAAFLTEVHHVTGDGEDAGVVYCEMQGRENTPHSRTFNRLLRLVYGDPQHCGYSAETGGKMVELRALKVDAVRDYHRQYYRPENLLLVIAGVVEPHAVFEALKSVEQDVLEARRASPPAPFVRPWQEPVPPFAESVEEVVLFPDEGDHEEEEEEDGDASMDGSGNGSDGDDEGALAVGHVLFASRAFAIDDFYRRAALDVLAKYLTDSPVSPLQRAFTNRATPLATSVSVDDETFCEGLTYFLIDGVKVDDLRRVRAQLELALRSLVGDEALVDADGETLAAFDLASLRAALHRQLLEHLETLENEPSSIVEAVAIESFLFAPEQQRATGDDAASYLSRALAYESLLARLRTEDAAFWRALIADAFLQRPVAVVIGEPSAALAATMQREEKERVARQVTEMGEQRLREAAAALEAANAENSRAPPENFVRDFCALPAVEPILHNAHHVETVRQGAPLLPATDGTALQRLRAQRVARLPFRVHQFDAIASRFASVQLSFDSSGVDASLRALLPLFVAVVFEMPCTLDGRALTHEEVVAVLDQDRLSATASIGVNGGSALSVGRFDALVSVTLRVEAAKYARAWQLLRALLIDVTRDETEWRTRLRIQAQRLLQEIPQWRRSGRAMASAALRLAAQDRASNANLASPVRQQRVLTRLLAELDDDAAFGGVVRRFLALRDALIVPERTYAHVIGDVARALPDAVVDDFVTPAAAFFGADVVAASGGDVDVWALPRPPASLAHADTSNTVANGYPIVGIASIESSFLVRCVPLRPLEIAQVDDPLFNAILVATSYLTALEGPLWKEVRGLGLAYGYGLSASAERALIVFSLTKSAALARAFAAARDIVERFATQAHAIDATALESAKGVCVFETFEAVETLTEAAAEAFMDFLANRRAGLAPAIGNIAAVDEDKVRAVLLEHVLPLFADDKAVQAVATNPAKMKDIASEMSGKANFFEQLDDYFTE